MKKLYVLLTLGVLACGMTACGSKDDAPTNDQAVVEDQNTNETDDTMADDTQADDTQTDEVTDPEADMPEGEGDAAATGWSEEMSALKQTVVDALGENYWPNMPMDASYLEGMYGITADMYDDFLGEIPMISTNVDTLLIIKAKDGKVEAVEEALNAYRDMLVSDTMQYPTNLGKIQASRIQSFGNYVCFVQLGADNLADEDMTEEESLVACQEQNELALEVIGKTVPQE